jgi:hypothetical protein
LLREPLDVRRWLFAWLHSFIDIDGTNFEFVAGGSHQLRPPRRRRGQDQVHGGMIFWVLQVREVREVHE